MVSGSLTKVLKGKVSVFYPPVSLGFSCLSIVWSPCGHGRANKAPRIASLHHLIEGRGKRKEGIVQGFTFWGSVFLIRKNRFLRTTPQLLSLISHWPELHHMPILPPFRAPDWWLAEQDSYWFSPIMIHPLGWGKDSTFLKPNREWLLEKQGHSLPEEHAFSQALC